MKNINQSRRNFLRQVSVLTAATAIPSFLNAENFPKTTPTGRILGSNEKVNLACVGIGFRGGDIIKAFAQTGLCNIVALCDIDMGAPHTESVLKMFPKVPRFQDFRKMFDQMSNQIDAVCIGTPDHSHFPIAMLAMSLGKHVYVEKPMAHTFYECELMMEAEKKYKVVTQMGNQGHSEANYFQFKAWQEAGIIKNVRAVTAHMNSPRRWHGWDAKMKNYLPGESIPKTMEWDNWLCGEAYHPYNKDYVNGQWRCWYDFGMGCLGRLGSAHSGHRARILPTGITHRNQHVACRRTQSVLLSVFIDHQVPFPSKRQHAACRHHLVRRLGQSARNSGRLWKRSTRPQHSANRYRKNPPLQTQSWENHLYR